MKRESFVFYASFYEAINEFPEANQIEVYRAIFEYALNGELVELSGMSKAVFALIKPQIDANNRRYENGKKGGRPSKNNQTETELKPNDNREITELKPNINQTLTETEPNVNVNDNVNVNANVNNIVETSSTSQSSSKRKSRKDQFLEYLDSLDYQPETKDILRKWIFAQGLKGNVTVDQLKDKLQYIWSVHDDEALVRESINNSYLSNYFAFFPVKQDKPSSPTFTPQTYKTPENTKNSPATGGLITRPRLSQRPEDRF